MSNSNKTHFSYVEILIIAIVLGAAARMIAPRFTEASIEEAKVSELVDGLEAMRAQLDLYRAQHEGYLPPTDSFASFETAMTTKVGEYGPYIKKIPTNPFNDLNTVRFDGEPAGVGEAGWRLDTKSGSFQADNEVSYAAL
jgi:type II secretory pathway pseudopilin PulG